MKLFTVFAMRREWREKGEHRPLVSVPAFTVKAVCRCSAREAALDILGRELLDSVTITGEGLKAS